jgi:DNA-binding transcriptional ArsR family regulator
MVLLPVRTAVLNYLFDVKEADVNQIMKALKPMYGTESQFNKTRFIDHVMSLEANGLVEETGYGLDDQGELSVRYKLNDEGIHSVKKYIPKAWRKNKS